jgi:lysophospholipase L1-like esterase
MAYAHPSHSGYQLMAEEWIGTVEKFWPKIEK